jgi:hypothetical protein
LDVLVIHATETIAPLDTSLPPESPDELRRASLDMKILAAIGVTTDWELEQSSGHSAPH